MASPTRPISFWAILLAVCPVLILPCFVEAGNPSISQALHQKFIRYTSFSAAAYASVCPTPPSGASVVQYFDVSSTDLQATLFRDDSAREFVLAFRGTSNLADFGTDFSQELVPYDSLGIDCADCMAHEGFLGAWNSASDLIVSALRTSLAAYPDHALTVTGHSMGGSLAALASASLVSPDVNVDMNLTTYTFGEPRTGNPAFANYIDAVLPPGRLFRVTHENDGVPQTVPVSAGYRHHSTEYWQRDPSSAEDTYQCSGQEPPDCNNSVLGIGIGAGFIGINAAHLKYSGISIGNPLDAGRSACSGIYKRFEA